MTPMQAWRVQVEACKVGRLSIVGQVVKVQAVDPTGAQIAAARQVGREAGVAPWLLRRLYLRCRAPERLEGGSEGPGHRGAQAAPGEAVAVAEGSVGGEHLGSRGAA